MRTAGVSETAVWRWQERFLEEGIDGLLLGAILPVKQHGERLLSGIAQSAQ
jgi:hypothetical protein